MFGSFVICIGVAVIASGVGHRVLVDPDSHRAIARGCAVMVVGAALLVLARFDGAQLNTSYAAAQAMSVMAAVVASSFVLVRFSKESVVVDGLSHSRPRTITSETRISRVRKQRAAAAAAGE